MLQDQQTKYFLDFPLKYKLNLQPRNDTFESTLKEHSNFYKIITNTQFTILTGLRIHLYPKEEIDDITFNRVILLFEMHTTHQNTIQHVIINQEQGNHLTPILIKKLLLPFTKSLKTLEMKTRESSGYIIDDWLLTIGQIFEGSKNLQQVFVNVEKFFTIQYTNDLLKVRIKIGATKNESFLKNLSFVCQNINFKYFNLKIEDDNVIKKGLDLLINSFTQQKELQSVSLTIGQSCQLSSSACFFESMKNHNLQSLKIKIGNSNTLESQVLQTIFEMIEKGLKYLTIDIGSSTKLFNQTKQIQNPLKLNNLEKLVFKIGKNNGFQNGGANILAHLLDTQKLLIVKIQILDSFQMSDLQSLQIYQLFQKFRRVKQFQLLFEREIFVNQYCLDYLQKFVQQNKNLISLSTNFSKQQQQLNLTPFFEIIASKRSLINIEISIGGSQQLPYLAEFGKQIKKSEFLSAFKIYLKGDNQLDYTDFRIFLFQLKQNQNLSLLNVQIAHQLPQAEQKNENNYISEIIKNTYIVGKPIFVNLQLINDQMNYEYDFDRLNLIGISNCISTTKLMPISANLLKINIIDEISEDQIKQLLSLIKNQASILIKTSLLDFIAKGDETQLIIGTNKLLRNFIEYTERNVTNLDFQGGNGWVSDFDLIFQLIQRQVAQNQEFFHYKLKLLTIQLEKQELKIQRQLNINLLHIEQQKQGNQFKELCQLIAAVSKFKITSLIIDFPIFTLIQNWELLDKAIFQLSWLQSLDLKLQNKEPRSGNNLDYLNFQQSLYRIFVKNLYLTKYDYFSEQEVVSQSCYLNLIQRMGDLDQKIKQKEEQHNRIINQQQNEEDLFVDMGQLIKDIQQLKEYKQLQFKYLTQGKLLENQKRAILISKRRIILSDYIAQKKFGHRNIKQESLTEIIRML